MRAIFSKEVRSRHAITDLYDEERRSFLVQYPIPLVVVLALTGVAAFMITGFLGYRDHLEPDITRTIFGKPWPLYLWFCALILTLQASILRHPSLRRQLVQTLSVTLFCIVFVGVVDYYNAEIVDALQRLLSYLTNTRVLLADLGTSPLTYSVINFLLIGIYWVDTIRRWIRRAQGKPPVRRADLGLNEPARPEDMPTMQELVSGDLIAGAFLTLILSLIFHPDIINFFTQALQAGTSVNGISVNDCTLSWPIGHCAGGANVHNPPTLAFIDLIQALVYLPIGLIILALSATVSGLGAVGGIDEGTTRPAVVATPQGASTTSVSEQVSLTVINTLQAAITRRARIAVGSLAGSLRNVAWPALILVSIIGVAGASKAIQQYLHLLSDQRTMSSLDPAEQAAVNSLLNQGLRFISPTLALLWGVLAIITVVLSAALLLFRVRVADNTLRFMGLIGFTVLLTFWIFSLALSVFNALFSLTHLSDRVPFPQPGVTTVLSFAALVIAGIVWLVSRFRSPSGGTPTQVPAEVPTQSAP
jgi:hypothetical protein